MSIKLTLHNQHLLYLVSRSSGLSLSCFCSPQVEWTFLLPSDSKPTVFPDQGSLSSHRQHGDGTYSVSSHLTVPTNLPPGTKITCTASHIALESPQSVSLQLETPEQGLLLSSPCGDVSLLYYRQQQWNWDLNCYPSVPPQSPTGGCLVSCSSLDFSSTKLWNKWVFWFVWKEDLVWGPEVLIHFYWILLLVLKTLSRLELIYITF